MKRKTRLPSLALLSFGLLSPGLGLSAAPLGTAFTYQGRLGQSGQSPSGTYDFQFAVYDALANGNPVGGTVTSTATAVASGLFTVSLDFGAGVFTGAARWLEIGVRTNGGGTFTTLTPRQPLTPTPFALYAPSAGAAATASSAQGVAANAVTGAGIASGQVVKSLNGLRDAVALAAGPNVSLATNANTLTISAAGAGASGGWTTTGNTGTTPGAQFLGTTDGQPLEFKVNGQRALRLEPHRFAPIVIGGHEANVVSFGSYGATIGGGGSSNFPNRVEAWYATVVGGEGNTASGYYSTAMGVATTASGGYSTAMGWATTASGDSSTAMGDNTTASGNSSTAMGSSTIASGGESTAMGWATTASGRFSTAMGYQSAATDSCAMAAGTRAKALHQGAFVWADFHDEADFSSTASNQFLIRATGGVGINKRNPTAALDVAGGVVVQADDTDVDSEANQLLIRGNASTAKQLEIGYKTSGNYATLQAIEQNVAFRPLILQPAGGRVGIGKTDPTTALDVNGTVTATAFNPPSDRNLKENFAAVSPREVLDKVAALPISRWNFKGDAATPHVGPMAQDFHAAFALGTDDRHIATVDADGVALAAIQGLNQKLEDRSQKLEKEVADLKALVRTLVEKVNGGAK